MCNQQLWRDINLLYGGTKKYNPHIFDKMVEECKLIIHNRYDHCPRMSKLYCNWMILLNSTYGMESERSEHSAHVLLKWGNTFMSHTVQNMIHSKYEIANKLFAFWLNFWSTQCTGTQTIKLWRTSASVICNIYFGGP